MDEGEDGVFGLTVHCVQERRWLSASYERPAIREARD